MMYALVTYANMRGVRAVDRIVELCERDLAFIWLAKDQTPKRDAFYNFKGEKLTPEILDDPDHTTNFRSSYRKLDDISYLIGPGEWI